MTAREEFYYIAGREGIPIQVARKIMRYAATVQRLETDGCNGTLDATGHFKLERTRDFIVNALKDIGDNYMGYGVTFQGDPRGACVKLTVPSGYTNDWGREGICVPAKG